MIFAVKLSGLKEAIQTYVKGNMSVDIDRWVVKADAPKGSRWRILYRCVDGELAEVGYCWADNTVHLFRVSEKQAKDIAKVIQEVVSYKAEFVFGEQETPLEV